MRPLVVPIPNMNGNSADSLLHRASEIRLAVQATVEAIRSGHDLWHGRNFQTVLDGDIRQKLAQEAWHQRLAWLDELEREIEQLMIRM